MSTGASKDKQHNMKDVAGGGNPTGMAPNKKLYQPMDFQGMAGQGDNQSTKRGKGRT